MNFENQTTPTSESEGQRLNADQAHKEANMLKEILGVDEQDHGFMRDEKGMIKWPTPEDYNQALETLEEMRRLAEEEPASKKMVFLMIRAAEQTYDSGRLIFRLLSMPYSVTDIEANKRHDDIMERFTTAGKKLKDLQAASKQYEKSE